MNAEHLQTVAFPELQRFQTVSDQWRIRQQDAFDNGGFLVCLRIRQLDIGLELDAGHILDLQ